MSRILVVEDDTHIRDLVVLHLGLEGFETEAVSDGQTALLRAGKAPYDLVILDLMLPGLDGVSVCRAIRRSGPNQGAPILMLTARREESDKVLGLESGADDYLTKPFGMRELMARVRALLRRPRQPAAAPSSAVIRVRGMEIDPARQRVRVEGRDVDLSPQEFRFVHLLASRPGIVFTREALLSSVWTDDTHVTERSVDTLVARVRRRIEPDPANPQYLLTVWGSGYRFTDV